MHDSDHRPRGHLTPPTGPAVTILKHKLDSHAIRMQLPAANSEPRANEPVLVVAFRRPDRLADVLERIRESGATRIYVAVDGPRTDDDLQAVTATQDVARAIDWAEHVDLRFRATNLGCRNGVIDAITWFLTCEPRGLIIEDDSMPSQSFFQFAHEMLAKHDADDQVLAVTGENLTHQRISLAESSYRYCKGGPCSAWGTWRSRWMPFVEVRPDRHPGRLLVHLNATPGQRFTQSLYWTALMVANKTRAMDSWAYAFMIYGVLTRRVTVTPNANLVEDRGVGESASHMNQAPDHVWAAEELSFPLRPPRSMVPDPSMEPWSYRQSVDFRMRDLLKGVTSFAKRLA